MRRHKYFIRSDCFITLIFIVIQFFTTCCDEEPLNIGMVSFITPDQTIDTENLDSITFYLEINPSAPTNSYIIINFISRGGSPGVAYRTSPEIHGGHIKLPVNGGETGSFFKIIPIKEGIAFNNVSINMEIIETGEGLSSRGIIDAYTSLTIINKKMQERRLPFIENFDECERSDGGGGLPAGWEEIVIQQNSRGTGHWKCSTGFGGIECNAYSSEGMDNDSCEIWLLTPRIDITSTIHPIMSLIVDRRFESINFQEYDVKVSTGFGESEFAETTWETYKPAVMAIEANDPESDNYETVNNLDLSSYIGNMITIAFIYYSKGSRESATILRLNQVLIEEKNEKGK